MSVRPETFDIEHFGSIFRLSIGYNRRSDVSGVVAVGRADFAAIISFLGQTMLEWLGI